jgi:isocitrate/isopropylmalate dehydrogenase
MMSEDGLERLASHDAIYFGAVGSKDVPDHVSLWGLRLRVCQGLDQWANIRPVRFLPNVPTPLRTIDPDHDWVVVRENSGGESFSRMVRGTSSCRCGTPGRQGMRSSEGCDKRSPWRASVRTAADAIRRCPVRLLGSAHE